MSKKTKPDTSVKKLSAADAIKGANRRCKVQPAGAKTLQALKDILAHNDTQTSHLRRVGWRTACEVLQSYGWTGATIHALDRVCREQLTRTSYSTP